MKVTLGGDTERAPEALGAENSLRQHAQSLAHPRWERLAPSDGNLETQCLSDDDLKESHKA